MDAGSDRCRCCGQRRSVASRTGRVIGTAIAILIGVVIAAPFVWLARVAAEWAMGIS